VSPLLALVLGLLLLVPALLVAIPVHEMGHAAAAYFLGDRSVRYFGYFSPDPRRFLDPMGGLAVFIALVGWGRRVPVQSNRISTTGQKVLFELGGPAANLLVALILGFLLRALLRAGLPISFDLGPGLLLEALYAIVFLNLSIFAFSFCRSQGSTAGTSSRCSSAIATRASSMTSACGGARSGPVSSSSCSHSNFCREPTC